MMDNKVRIVFSCEEQLSARFKIRLQYDKLQQVQFFEKIIQEYLNNDIRVIQIIQELKDAKKVMSKKKSDLSTKEHLKASDLMKRLGITDSDKSKIFDLIENDSEDYD